MLTENIIWSSADKNIAEEHHVQIITERELRYYIQIAEHLGHAARYQFLAEFLNNQSIPELRSHKIPAIQGKLGGNKFYCFVTTPKDLLKISFVNHRSLNDPEGIPTYQRLITSSRLRQIGNYIKDGGFFPTNILVNFTKKVRFESVNKDTNSEVKFGCLYLPDKYRSAWIIDGQHRLFGYSNLSQKYLSQNIVVLAFEEMSKEEEANLFVTINHEQKSVPKTLLDDLEGELKWGSDIPSERIGAISSRLINIINDDFGEPFYNRITKQGIKATDFTCLTVPAIKEALKKSGLLGIVARRKDYVPGPLSDVSNAKNIDYKTLDRGRSAINQYFSLIKNSNEKQWDLGRAGLLCANVAVQGYILLLASLIEYMEANKGLDAKDLSSEEIIMEIEEYFEPVMKYLSSASGNKIENDFRVQFGTGGPKEYYFRLCKIIKDDFSDFTPDGMSDWESIQSDENIQEADSKLKKINIMVQDYIFKTFKSEYGKNYWEEGVLNREIKTKAYGKGQDYHHSERLPLEHYLDFIDYKKIIEHKSRWPLFSKVFNISSDGSKGKTKDINWMDRINELRRIPAHATKKRKYKPEDFEFIDYIFSRLVENIESNDEVS